MLRLAAPYLHKGVVSLLSSTKSLSIHCCSVHTSSQLRMELRAIVSALEKVAPTKNAAEWDNVGLLVEPKQQQLINRVLLTNDLTEEVMDEVIELPGRKIGLIISYHPPIFRPLKRLTQTSPKERIVLRAVEAGVGIYSPHTSLDNMERGINEWLLKGVGEGEVSALGVTKTPAYYPNVVRVRGVRDGEELRLLEEMVGKMSGGGVQQVHSENTSFPRDVYLHCTDQSLAILLPKLKNEFASIEISSNIHKEVFPSGGKLLTLCKPTPLSVLVENTKNHLQLKHVRLAKPYNPGALDDPLINTVATCCGSGASVLRGVDADLYLSGEMSHHEVLAATAQGTAVVLCEHSNTERGYLQTVYKKMVEDALDSLVEVVVSLKDKDPLDIV